MIARALGEVDAHGVRGARTWTWAERGLDPEAAWRWRDLDSRSEFPAFRRMDALSRAVCLACEVADVRAALADLDPREVAVIAVWVEGCLDADVRFAQSLAPDAPPRPGLFPYTLPSTCLGHVAIRWGLRGPTLCFSEPTLSRAAARARDEAAALLDDDAAAAVVAWGSWVPTASATTAGVPPALHLGAALVAPDGADAPRPADPGAALRAWWGEDARGEDAWGEDAS